MNPDRNSGTRAHGMRGDQGLFPPGEFASQRIAPHSQEPSCLLTMTVRSFQGNLNENPFGRLERLGIINRRGRMAPLD